MTDGAEESGVAWGMQVLLAQRTEAIAGGADPVGWKIGLNATGAQQLFGLDGPVVGYLLSPTVLAPGESIAIGGWAKPALEVEVAIRVGDDGQVAALAPALELVDLGDLFGEIGQILAANICHRGVVFGEEITGGLGGLGGLGALDDLVAHLRVEVISPDGDVRAAGTLAEAPSVTVDVVRSFLETHGATLSPGDRIIAGSIITPLSIAPGDAVTVTFGPLGILTAQFT